MASAGDGVCSSRVLGSRVRVSGRTERARERRSKEQHLPLRGSSGRGLRGHTTPTGPRPRAPAPGRSHPSAPTSAPTSGHREESPHAGTLPDLVPRPSRASPATGDPQSGLAHGAPRLRALLPDFTLPGSRGLPARQQPRSSFALDFSKAVVLSPIPSPHTFCCTGLRLSPEKTGHLHCPLRSRTRKPAGCYFLLTALPSQLRSPSPLFRVPFSHPVSSNTLVLVFLVLSICPFAPCVY